ncbi:MAG: immunoglobulin domain-containing protein [Candidatus Didemnitutus sp.]|nr:immunoglobulin domain-containing protein [Candidatus Didemnitutus sp.]
MHQLASPAPSPSILRRFFFVGFARLCAAIALSFGALEAPAKIGAAHQLLLGNPSGAVSDPAARNNYLIVRDQFAISYNDSLGQPNWVSWNLTQEDRGSSGRTDAWSEDPLLPAGYYRVQPSDYNDPGLSRGHMCPSADRTVTTSDNTFTFLMSNMVPQTSHNNGGVWNNFEMETRTIAGAGNEVLVISGPSHFSGARIASGKAAIPGYVWKIAVVVPVGPQPVSERITTNTRVIAIKVPNVTSGLSSDWRTYLTNVNQIQQDTGLTFFTALPAATASVLRTMIDGRPLTGAPVIATNPTAQSLGLGTTAVFTVSASGDAPLNYQWTFEGQPVGTNSATLTISNVQLANMGHYRVTVSNNISSATSEQALLVVTGVAPSFLNEPVSQTVNAGSTVVFSTLVAGSPTMTYQWHKNGQPLDGAHAATLTLHNVQSDHAGTYNVVATNSDGNATSADATLSVTARAPVITAQPVSSIVGPNGTARFTVGLVGSEPFTYVWRRGGTPIEGNASAATASLVLPNVTESLIGTYDVVITNAQGMATSDTAQLVVSSFSDGALNYAGGTYRQNFDSLSAEHGYDSNIVGSLSGNGPFPLTAAPFNGSDLGGWWMVKHGGSGLQARFKVDDGTSINGAIYSYGASGSSERALGSLGSGSTQSRFGLMLNNNTGQTLSEFTITFVGEQWREGNGAANVLAFSYAIGGSNLNTGSFVSAPALSFSAPINGTTDSNGIILDGNAPANRRNISATVSGIVWPASSRLILRWTDSDDANNDDGLAIDDFAFTAAAAGPVAPVIIGTTPTHDASGQSATAPITVTFNQPVTVASGWFTLRSAASGVLPATVSGGPSTYTITPSAAFMFGDTITVDVRADRVTDAATNTLNLAEDYTFSFRVLTPFAPLITTHPVPRHVFSGENVIFAVTAEGTAPITYQWRKGGQPIANANNPTLTLTNVQAADTGSYDVVLTNGVGNATSNAATLTISVLVTSVVTWDFTTAAPSNSLPVGLTGGTVTQGNNNGTTTLLTSGVDSTYPGASAGNNAGLAARTGSLNTATNGSAYFQFTLTPAAGSRLLATGLAFGTRSTSTGPKAYALYTSADNYATPAASGTLTSDSVWVMRTPSFTTVIGSLDAPITFRLYGYNGSGSAGVGTANWRIDDLALTVAIQTPPAITSQPASQTVAAGSDVTFSVTATGTETLTYQWRHNGNVLSGATSNSLSLSAVQAAQAGNYDVVITNPVAAVTSSVAVLTISAASGYDAWRNENFDTNERANAAISGPAAVLTSDGLTNLLKYALGRAPRASGDSLGTLDTSAGQLAFTYARPAARTDITYAVESSSDLVTWSAANVTHERLETNAGTETWRATAPLPAGTRTFLRLRVSTQ